MSKDRRSTAKKAGRRENDGVEAVKKTGRRATDVVDVPKKGMPKKIKLSSTQSLIKANLLALACLSGLVVSNLGLVWYSAQSKKEVIAITETGSIINPVPLPQAFVNDARVLSFTDTCLRESFSHDFENYRRTVNAAMSCYTRSGGEEFKKELEKTLQDVTQKRLVMSITLEPPSLIRGPYISSGRATWEVQTIVTIFYQGTQERYQPQTFAVNVTVTRVGLEESTSGISINAIQLRRTNIRSFY